MIFLKFMRGDVFSHEFPKHLGGWPVLAAAER